MLRVKLIVPVLLACAMLARADSISMDTVLVDQDDGMGGMVTIPVPATMVTFSFDQIAPGSFIGPTDSIEIVNSANPEYVMRLSRPGSFLGVADLSPFVGDGVPSEWGSTSLDPFIDFFNPAPILFEVIGMPVGQSVLYLTVEVGDFGPSDNDLIRWDSTVFGLGNQATPGFTSQTQFGIPNGSGAPQSGPVFDFALGAGGASVNSVDIDNSSLFWDQFTIVSVATDDLPDSVPAPVSFVSFEGDIPGYIPGATVPSTPPQPVPEPGSLVLCAAGVAGLIAWRRRQNKA
ncbi:MAG: PEP-CTERM sorting domain-containing protein [Planctomycetota bacterium]